MHNAHRLDFDLIADDASLVAWCDNAARASFVAIDTEFERQRTFFAELCLVQVATKDAIACIDPQAGLNLEPLFRLFADPRQRKIIHSGRQDLEVLHFAGASALEPLIDTQIAAALAGFTEQIGYADLVLDLFGVKLDKSQTRTDWRQRPLTPKQLAYAADDVRYLDAVTDALMTRLDRQNRLPWLFEDCAALRAPELLDPPIEDAWQKVKGLGALPDNAFARAIDLAAWREAVARERDLPRSWVLKDQDLVTLAVHGVADKRELADTLGLDSALVRRDGDAIIAVLLACTEHRRALPSRTAAPSGEQRQAVKRLAAQMHDIAAGLGINASVLITRREIEQIVCGGVPARIRNGWRGEILGGAIAAWTGSRA